MGLMSMGHLEDWARLTSMQGRYVNYVSCPFLEPLA